MNPLLLSILCLIAAGLIMWLIAPAWLYVVLTLFAVIGAIGFVIAGFAFGARWLENLERDRP